MDIRNIFGKKKPQTIPVRMYDGVTLSRGKNGKKKITFDLQRMTDALTRKDIADWRRAWQLAINVDNPDRRKLYNIYRDVDVDGHLSGCVTQRMGFVKKSGFKLVDAESGDDNEEATHYLDQDWFSDLMNYILQSVYYGHSLIELGDITTDGDGHMCFDGVTLIPRSHVIPEYGRVIRQLGEGWRSGIDYREEPYSKWIIEAGEKDDLGLYLKAALHTIPKKNAMAFWDSYAEIFGSPTILGKTPSRDEKERNKLLNVLEQLGFRGRGVVSSDTEIEFVESSRSDAYNVYDRRIDRANSEISKIIIGQTMTIEDGSSLSQSETHLEVFNNLVQTDKKMVRDIVNNQLLPKMAALGFPMEGLRFEWDDTVSYTPEQQVSYETMVADRYEVDPEYFATKYNMPVGQRISLYGDSGQPDEPAAKGTQNNSRPFFD